MIDPESQIQSADLGNSEFLIKAGEPDTVHKSTYQQVPTLIKHICL